jgi:superfamily II DNA or RNA helicase
MSDTILVHPFKDILPDIDEFFLSENEEGIINTVNSFCNRVKYLSEKYSDKIDSNKFKGNSLELLAEFLCKFNGSDNRVGIYDYIPVESNDDTGVDGYGKGENKFPSTVQVKFRSGDYVLRANDDHLSNFLNASTRKCGVRMKDTKNMLIITTGLKVDEWTLENMLYNSVRVLNRDALREMLDKRVEWWTRFYESVKSSRVKIQPKLIPQTLREHQVEGVKSTTDKNLGKIILPTGTGKTRVESEIIRKTILEKQKAGIVPLIKVNSSRILLCFQLFEDIFNYLNSHGITARYMNFNSGKADEKSYIEELGKSGNSEFYREIISTTNPNEVSKIYLKACQEKIPLIIISTYHSSNRCALSGLVPHLTINDEAHNLVSTEFSKVAELPSEKNFFLTATEKITDSDGDLGMNNPEIFGEVIYEQSPKQMIEKGEMVPPYVHVVRSKAGQNINLNKLEKDYDALVNSIYSAFDHHQQKLNETSYNPSELGAKVLVVCRGQEDLEEMFKTNVFTNLRQQHPDIHIFALSSDFGTYVDGVKERKPVLNVKKHRLLKLIKSLPPSAKMILFHVDMVGEGIDVPGLTGVMPFRNCELTKFVQNIGRASRLHPQDRSRFYKGEISTSDRTKWIKPLSWVIIPTFLENSEGFAGRFREIIQKLKIDFGYIPQQHTVIDNVRGLEEDEPIDTVNEIEKNRRHEESGLEEFEHQYENMGILEKIIFDDKYEEECETIRNEFESLIEGL